MNTKPFLDLLIILMKLPVFLQNLRCINFLVRFEPDLRNSTVLAVLQSKCSTKRRRRWKTGGKKLRLNCSTGKILVSKEEDSLDRKLISLKGCIVHKNDTRKQLIPEYKQFKAEENQLEIQLWVETEREGEKTCWKLMCSRRSNCSIGEN